MNERPSRVRSSFVPSSETPVPPSRVRSNMDTPELPASRVRINMGPTPEVPSPVPTERVSRLRGTMGQAALAKEVNPFGEVVTAKGDRVEPTEGIPERGAVVRRVRPEEDGGDIVFTVRGARENPAGETRISLVDDHGRRTNIGPSDLSSEPVDGKAWRAEPKPLN